MGFEFSPQTPEEYAAPPTVPQTEVEIETHARTGVPAYQRGPSYASEVDNLSEPQVLQQEITVREETILVRQYISRHI